MSENLTLETALWLETGDFWSVPLYSNDVTRKNGSVTTGKEPFGCDWAVERNTADDLRSYYRDHPAGGLGIALGPGRGPGGVWLIDLEGDGPDAEESRIRLYGGEVVNTAGWSSVRGKHELLIVDRDKMTALMPGMKALEGKGLSSGVFHLNELPGLELRIGGFKEDGTIKQLQSACPPTRGTDGAPRRWNDVASHGFTIANAPESVYQALERAAAQGKAKAAATPGDAAGKSTDGPKATHRGKPRGTGDRAESYVCAALEEECRAVASAAEGTRNSALNASAFSLGTLVGAGVMDRGEAERALLAAARQCGLPECEAAATVRSGLDAGAAKPRDLSGLGERRGHAERNGQRGKGDTAGPRINPADPDDGGDDAEPIADLSWPAPPDPRVYHGPIGAIVRAIEPETEADPLGLLVQTLLLFGNVVGRGPHVQVESTRHYTNENVVTVGETALGRKGTGLDRAREPVGTIDRVWMANRIKSGLSSGEGLISAVRDQVVKRQPIKDKGRVTGYEDVIDDPGVDDKRLVAEEPEFGGVLKALEREGNKLSALIRQAWDGRKLATLTKSPLTATDPHISIIGHITMAELRSLLSTIDIGNGFANRFLWFAVKRSKLLPHGGGQLDLTALTNTLAEAVAFAQSVGRVVMTPAARGLWESHYERLTTPPPGVLGAVTSRAAPHVLRLALIYALADQSRDIADDHLDAALALWDASARCATLIFGESLGDPDAEKILVALRSAPGGLSRSEIRSQVFQRNRTAARIEQALGLLLRHGLVREVRDTDTGGRPACRYYAIDAKNAKTPTGSDAPSPSAGRYGVNGVNGVAPGAEANPTDLPPYGVNSVNGDTQGAEANPAAPGREVFEL